MIDFIRSKNTHKGTVPKDIMLIRFATLTGLRRSELARLIAGDIQIKQKVVFVRKGKGDEDRTVPLLSFLINALSEYIRDMKPADSVFGLTERSITDKVSTWSKKAGLKLHPHSFRHYFAEQLLERGVPLTVVSALLGHKDHLTMRSLAADDQPSGGYFGTVIQFVYVLAGAEAFIKAGAQLGHDMPGGI